MPDPKDLSKEARFALDPIGMAKHEDPTQEDPDPAVTLRALKQEFIGDDPIRLWLYRHSAAFYAIVDTVAMEALREGHRAIRPHDVADHMERMRTEQMASWGAFDTGRQEGR